MKYVPGPEVGVLSRSQGNTTASHNRFGAYLRNRVIPVNPDTASQRTQRDALHDLSQLWRGLTSTQRAGWTALGSTIVRNDTLGQPYTMTGLQTYTSCNRALIYAGLAQITDAPLLVIVAGPTSITPTATAA